MDKTQIDRQQRHTIQVMYQVTHLQQLEQQDQQE
jgi:hypothetical protein